MKLSELRQAEIDQAEDVADDAATLQRKPLSRVTVTAATKIIARLQVDERRGAIIEPARDVAELILDNDLMRDLAADMDDVRNALIFRIPEWMEQGWRAEIAGQQSIMRKTAPAVTITATMSADEYDALKLYPVNGHPAAAVAQHLATRLEYDVHGSLGVLLQDAATARDVPQALDEIQREHSERVRNVARESFFAGCQSARLALGYALQGQ